MLWLYKYVSYLLRGEGAALYPHGDLLLLLLVVDVPMQVSLVLSSFGITPVSLLREEEDVSSLHFRFFSL